MNKEAFIKTHEANKELAIKENHLFRAHGVVGMCVKNKSYYVQAVDHNGVLFESKVENYWVKDNFNKEILKHVQEEDYFDVSNEKGDDGKNIEALIDNRIVHKKKYCITTNKWMGLSYTNLKKDGKNKKEISTFPIYESWIAENYTTDYVENTKEYFEDGQKRFINLNDGAPKNESVKNNYNAEFVQNINMKWNQGKNERSCMILCVANF